MSPEPFVSRAKSPPAKRSEKGYGEENGSSHIFMARTLTRTLTRLVTRLTRMARTVTRMARILVRL